MENLHKQEHSLHNNNNFNKHHTPYWKRMHQDWRFWIGFVLIIIALSIYIMSVDFSIQPNI
jgi:hypothetical protein